MGMDPNSISKLADVASVTLIEERTAADSWSAALVPTTAVHVVGRYLHATPSYHWNPTNPRGSGPYFPVARSGHLACFRDQSAIQLQRSF